MATRSRPASAPSKPAAAIRRTSLVSQHPLCMCRPSACLGLSLGQVERRAVFFALLATLVPLAAAQAVLYVADHHALAQFDPVNLRHIPHVHAAAVRSLWLTSVPLMGLLIIAFVGARLLWLAVVSLLGVGLLAGSIWATPFRLGSITPTVPSHAGGLLWGHCYPPAPLRHSVRSPCSTRERRGVHGRCRSSSSASTG